MKKLLAIAALAASLGGCATLSTEWANLSNAVGTVTGSTVSPQAVIVAGNAMDALEGTAANYLNFCKANRTNVTCVNYVAARKKIIPAVRAVRVARVNLESFMAAHPGQLGPSGLYDALTAALATAQSIANQYIVTTGAQ